MRYWQLVIALLCIQSIVSIQTPYILYFYVYEYPIPKPKCINAHPGLLHLEPGRLCTNIIQKKFERPNSVGIIAAYNGQIAQSDKNGKLVFQRTTQQENFFLIVTPRLQPVYDIDNTIAYFYLPENTGYQAFNINKILDQDTSTYLWQVEPTTLPANKKIPSHSIIIYAKPDNVVIPTGVTMTHNNPNLTLPPIYVRPTINHLDNALFILNIKQYFAPIRRLYNQAPSQLGYDVLTTTHVPLEQDI